MAAKINEYSLSAIKYSEKNIEKIERGEKCRYEHENMNM
jgi:hypothetical protein